mmetsp:Transcript_20097/g.30216  ORF Transcript_20097/g.30216 Transcript_20097/m.30216 type:complete len:123 (-) Transcript_20097:201-569(-)
MTFANHVNVVRTRVTIHPQVSYITGNPSMAGRTPYNRCDDDGYCARKEHAANHATPWVILDPKKIPGETVTEPIRQKWYHYQRQEKFPKLIILNVGCVLFFGIQHLPPFLSPWVKGKTHIFE